MELINNQLVATVSYASSTTMLRDHTLLLLTPYIVVFSLIVTLSLTFSQSLSFSLSTSEVNQNLKTIYEMAANDVRYIYLRLTLSFYYALGRMYRRHSHSLDELPSFQTLN